MVRHPDFTKKVRSSVVEFGITTEQSAKADIVPDYRKFDRALATQVRPVLVPLRRSPFPDFTAEEFLGQTVITCRGPGGCASVFTGSKLTLGDMADAGVYFGGRIMTK